MINPNGLMLGNFISHNGVAGSGKIIAPIEAFNRTTVVAGIRDSYANFAAIPLTEKILIDSGFEFYYENKFGKQFELKTGSSRFYVVINDEKNTFAIQLEFAPINNIRCHETSYVHNLQNAYRLATGNDLEIVINV